MFPQTSSFLALISIYFLQRHPDQQLLVWMYSCLDLIPPTCPLDFLRKLQVPKGVYGRLLFCTLGPENIFIAVPWSVNSLAGYRISNRNGFYFRPLNT